MSSLSSLNGWLIELVESLEAGITRDPHNAFRFVLREVRHKSDILLADILEYASFGQMSLNETRLCQWMGDVNATAHSTLMRVRRSDILTHGEASQYVGKLDEHLHTIHVLLPQLARDTSPALGTYLEFHSYTTLLTGTKDPSSFVAMRQSGDWHRNCCGNVKVVWEVLVSIRRRGQRIRD